MWRKGRTPTTKLCMTRVPCRQTLLNHMAGKDHLKRLKQKQEALQKEGKLPRNERYGYQTGPENMARLTGDELAKMRSLEQDNSNLRRTIQEAERKNRECKENHGGNNLKEQSHLIGAEKAI